MSYGIQKRLLIWLLLVALPIAAASIILVKLIDTRLTQRVYAGLENDHRLEAARIEAGLDQYATYAKSLSIRPELRQLLNQYLQQNINTESVASNFKERLSKQAKEIQLNAQMLQSGVAELKIMTRDGYVSGQTSGFTWQPIDKSTLAKSTESPNPVFGNAFRTAQGHARVGVIAPVFNKIASDAPATISMQQAIGFLIIEMELGPIVDLVEAHEGLGATSESHIAQPTAQGDAQFITLLRFKRDAAFNLTVPKIKNKPINWSLVSPELNVVRSPDYRNIDSLLAIGTIASTGWGLVVKIDSEEAFTAVAEVKRLILIAAGISLVVLLLSWLVMLRPLGRRLTNVMNAADRVTAGEYGNVNKDSVNDEIGALSHSINLLARELANDQELRDDVECKLKYQAEHDSLTGLFNRKHLQDVITELDRKQASVGNTVLFLDLDGFKQINDQNGHHIGDEILVGVAGALTNILPTNSKIGRWGGDEFVVIFEGVNEKQARQLAITVSDRFEQAFETSAGKQYVGCSVGTAVTSANLSTSDCVQLADERMYDAKQEQLTSSSSSSERLTAISFVRESIEEKRVEVWYQPLIKATRNDDAQLIGAEALLRTRDAQGEIIPPGDYLPHLNDEKISAQLDRLVLARVFNDVQKWRHAGLVEEEFYVNVNLSGATVRHDSLPKSLENWLKSFDLPAHCIGLELSESTRNIDMDVILALKDVGLRLAVDDIGVQNSNLVRLAAVSPDMAKFDRIWVIDEPIIESGLLPADVAKRKLVVLQNMLKVCSELGMQCIVEGVETEEQFERLLSLGVSRFQGFLFDAALPPGEFVDKLHNALPSLWSNTCQGLDQAV